MSFQDTALFKDVVKVIKDPLKPIKFHYSGKIHTKKDDLYIFKIITIDLMRDYVGNIGDVMFLEIMMPIGDYVKDFYPYRDNLEVTLNKTFLDQTSGRALSNEVKQRQRYKAIFLVDQNPVIKASEYDNIDRFTLNLKEPITVHLQLLDKSLEPIRIKTTGGVFKDTTVEKVMNAVIPGESLKISYDGKKCIDAYDIVKPDNTEKLKHILIPQMTKIISVATYLQESGVGVYNAGIGSYLQSYNKKMTWFVYPLFNVERFNENVPKCVIYSVPRGELPFIEKTYKITANTIYIIANGEKKYISNGEADLMDKGSGFRMTDARTIMRKPVDMKNDGPVGIRNKINYEINNLDRKDNLNHIPLGDSFISSNPFARASKILERSNSVITLSWTNSNPYLIYPGMPVKYIYLNKKNRIEQTIGIILFCQSSIQMMDKGVIANVFESNSILSLYVKRLKDTEDAEQFV